MGVGETDVGVGVGETAGPVAVAVGSGLQAAARAMTATKPKVGVLIQVGGWHDDTEVEMDDVGVVTPAWAK